MYDERQAALRTQDELEESKAGSGVSVEDAAVSTEDLGVGVESEAGLETGVTESSGATAGAAVEGVVADADVTAASIPQVSTSPYFQAHTNNFRVRTYKNVFGRPGWLNRDSLRF